MGTDEVFRLEWDTLMATAMLDLTWDLWHVCHTISNTTKYETTIQDLSVKEGKTTRKIKEMSIIKI